MNNDSNKTKENRLYGELFVYCLTQHNMLCWGVYRFRDSGLQVQQQDNEYQQPSQKQFTPSNKRYVVCNPSADFRLMPTDLVYVLEQFNPASSSATPMKKSGAGVTRAPPRNQSNNSFVAAAAATDETGNNIRRSSSTQRTDMLRRNFYLNPSSVVDNSATAHQHHQQQQQPQPNEKKETVLDYTSGTVPVGAALAANRRTVNITESAI